MIFTVTVKYWFTMGDRTSLKETTLEIREFFTARSVFITGGTGFIGAVLLEKLLRACPEIATIYLLIRLKRHADVHDRVGALFDSWVSRVFYQREYLYLMSYFPRKKAGT
jgi:hypothetical protein